MSKILVSQGSAITEVADAVINAQKIFNISIEKPLLIVEGQDDIDVIKNYFYMKHQNVPWKVVVGSSLGTKVNGKKNALTSFNKYKDESVKMFCLLDRDYDFIIGKQEKDENIFYYDFFELENYLFEEDIIRLIYMKYFNCNTNDKYIDLSKKLNGIKPIFEYLFRIRLFRELHYLNKTELILDKNEIIQYCEICNPKFVSVFSGKNPKNRDAPFNDRLKVYLEKELKLLNANINKCIIKITEEYLIPHNELEFLQMNLSGKDISKIIVNVLEHLFGESRTDNGLDILNLLKTQWIPSNSKKFKELLTKIEEKSHHSREKETVGA